MSDENRQNKKCLNTAGTARTQCDVNRWTINSRITSELAVGDGSRGQEAMGRMASSSRTGGGTADENWTAHSRYPTTIAGNRIELS